MFQARDYTGNLEPKYLNPLEIDKSKVVFNLHRQKFLNPFSFISFNICFKPVCPAPSLSKQQISCFGLY